MRIEYHRTLIADRVRLEAFAASLKAVIVPGVTRVADIGAGTGILGLIAERLGAREVFLYESAQVAGVAEATLKANRSKVCRLMPFSSIEVDEPPQVDVVVSETLGNYALEENIIDTLNDARKRYLKPGGVIIPAGIAQWVAPVVSVRIDQELRVWESVGAHLGLKLDLSAAQAMSANNIYVRTLSAHELLADGHSALVWDEIDFGKLSKSARKGEVKWRMSEARTVYGFAAWWTARLGPDVVLSTAPGATPTHWEQLYLPLMAPLELVAGQTLNLSVRSRSSEATGTHIAWTASILDASGKARARQAMDLDKGWIE